MRRREYRMFTDAAALVARRRGLSTFCLASPNAPDLGDPRGLTQRKYQVVTYVARKKSATLISFRLGLSRQRVSKLLRDGMHRLSAATQAQHRGRFRFEDMRSAGCGALFEPTRV